MGKKNILGNNILLSVCFFATINVFASTGALKPSLKKSSLPQVEHNQNQAAMLPDSTVSQIVANGATPRLISDQFNFTEGPAADKAGNIFFTDQPNNKIWKFSTDEKLSVFLDNAGRSNGLAFDKKGNLISCADEQNQLWSINSKGKIKVLLEDFQGQRLNGPNDLWLDAKGGIYFTDPFYERSYWTRKKPDLASQNVYYLPKGKKEPIMVAGDLQQPNGIIGTPDGKFLFVADIKGNKTYKYTLAPDGSLQNKTLFVEQGSDGMTIDEKGNIYLTGRGVTVYNPEGKKIQHINIPARWTGNVTFGGKDRQTLFITASESVFVLPMLVKGVN